MKKRSATTWLLAILAVLSLLAAGCGGDDDKKKDEKSSDKTETTKGDDTPTTEKGMEQDFAKLSGTLDGQGSSFQDTFEQAVSSDFNAAVKKGGGNLTVKYTKSGSSDGRAALADKSTDFAGSDGAPIKDEEKPKFGDREILYFPIVGGPIALAYNVKGVDELNLSPETLAKIFSAKITTWDDDAIKKDNPDAKLPSTPITVVHRSDGSGTTKNFTKFLEAAAESDWTLGSGDEVNWDPKTQGAEKSTGVTSVVKSTDGAITYVDLADAAKEKLNVANVKDAAGEFVAPTPDAASKAIESAELADDLTYDPINAEGEGAYPITSPTWILVDAKMADQKKADAMKAYLTYMLTEGQAQAKDLLYSPLPEEMAKKALEQVDKITAG